MPNNKKLYSRDILQDINVNVCNPITDIEISAKKIKYGDKTYYYTDAASSITGNALIIYKYDDNVGKYVELNKNDPIYADITKKILGF
jgi:hypothetical protein